MFRLIMTLLSSIYLNIFDIKSNYALVMEKNNTEEILAKVDDVILKRSNTFTFKNDSFEVNINDETIEEIVNYYYLDNTLYILAKKGNDFYYLIIDTKNNKEIYFDKLANYLNLEDYYENRKITSCQLLKDDLTFVGTLGDEDVFIGSKDNLKIFKSSYREKVYKTIYYQNYYYMYIEKDLISEEPFGNGSKQIIVKLSKTFDIVQICYLEEDNYLDFFIENSLIYLKSTGFLKTYTLNLKYCTKVEIKPSDCVFSGKNGLIIVFSEECNYLLDGLTLIKLGKISKIDEVDNGKIIKLSDSFYFYKDGESMYFDIVDFTKLTFLSNGALDYENSEAIYSFFGKCIEKSRIYDTYFDKGVYGKYNGSIEYATIANLSFVLNFVYDIPLKVNIFEGGVYRSGYHLLFNGRGTLDGENIYNNEPIYDLGYHTLIIEGNGESKQINFIINNNQIDFEDELIDKGLLFDINEDIVLELKFTNYDNYEIKKLNFVHSSCDNYTFENGVLKIKYPKETEATNKEIFLKSIIFDVYGLEYEYQINRLFYINVIDKKTCDRISPICDLNSTKIKYKLDDVKARMLCLQVINASSDKYTYYGLYNQEIIIDKLDSDTTFKLFLIYDSGSCYYTEYELANGIISSNENRILKISINAYEENVKEFTVDFKEKAVKLIKVNNKIVYTSTELDIEKIIVFSVISLVSSFFVGKLLQIIFRRKRKTI